MHNTWTEYLLMFTKKPARHCIQTSCLTLYVAILMARLLGKYSILGCYIGHLSIKQMKYNGSASHQYWVWHALKTQTISPTLKHTILDRN